MSNIWEGAYKLSFFHPLLDYLVFANGIRLKYIKPLHDTEVIPLSDRVFLGGQSSLRGFSLYSVGPRGEFGNVLGGDHSVNMSSELHVEFTEQILGVLFLDIGQAFLDKKGSFSGEDFDISDLRYAPGFGFRYRTPIGPIKVELGFALDREFGERSGRLNIGIGGGF